VVVLSFGEAIETFRLYECISEMKNASPNAYDAWEVEVSQNAPVVEW